MHGAPSVAATCEVDQTNTYSIMCNGAYICAYFFRWTFYSTRMTENQTTTGIALGMIIIFCCCKCCKFIAIF